MSFIPKRNASKAKNKIKTRKASYIFNIKLPIWDSLEGKRLQKLFEGRMSCKEHVMVEHTLSNNVTEKCYSIQERSSPHVVNINCAGLIFDKTYLQIFAVIFDKIYLQSATLLKPNPYSVLGNIIDQSHNHHSFPCTRTTEEPIVFPHLW